MGPNSRHSYGIRMWVLGSNSLVSSPVCFELDLFDPELKYRQKRVRCAIVYCVLKFTDVG